MTACRECKHIIDTSGNDYPRWYDFQCNAQREPDVFDFLNGETNPGEPKDCRTVNLGACPYFERP